MAGGVGSPRGVWVQGKQVRLGCSDGPNPHLELSQLLRNSPWVVVEFAKCFDLILQLITLMVAEEQGLDTECPGNV